MALFDASPRWTVTNLTRHLRQLLEGDPDLQGIWVEGEISNLSRPASGHIYFTLKDAGASLRCVMWKTEAIRLRLGLQDGLAIEAHGSLGIYEVAGQYQLYADDIRPKGEGALFQEFLRLKALLEAEGLFDTRHKRAIPSNPHRIGIVTSRTGAALMDMLNTLRRRMPLAEVIVAATPVQGDEAPLKIVEALRGLNRVSSPEVILLGRGGGSIEDLWAFNDERVVRAIYESQAPVITGVGHETDFTLADFASDLRAPTPTAAAELATVVTVFELHQGLIEILRILSGSMEILIDRQRNLLEGLQSGLRAFSPMRMVQTERQRLDEMSRRGNSAYSHYLELAKAQRMGLGNRLIALSPLGVLKRGYAVVTKNQRVIASSSQVKDGDNLRVRVQDGEFGVRVTGEG